ncbi:MAG: Mur ligase family protein [Syntrophobacteraceae bacterium]|jgi:UDP-N-acetylmuramate: L-alanyl-gamma-D-glutamyl-meso-diaminopimelate ligase
MENDGFKKIYMVGIGGIAMGTLATMLKQSGFEVAGSDQNLYPPMSTHLRTQGIALFEGFSMENPQKFDPDLFIIGNVVRRENPEAQFILSQDRPCLSMPQAVSRLFLNGRRSIVVAGTHGKSTTASLLGWVLEQGGKDPGAFIGAFLKDWDRSYRLGKGEFMVLEGDEYDTAFFDKGPKFLHYQPYVGIVTGIEFDHADIFADLESILQAFRNFVRLIPERGYLIINADNPDCTALAPECKGQVITYGRSHRADWHIKRVDFHSGEVSFQLRIPGTFREETFRSRLAGKHNVWNLTAAIAAASIAGMTLESIREAVEAFNGVKRRQEVVGEFAGVLVMDDFAHHPTSVHETLQGLKLFYPERRLIAAFEPRSNSSRRNVFQDVYPTAFSAADLICIKQPPAMESIPEHQRLDARRLVDDIRKTEKDAHFFQTTDELLGFLLQSARPGDLIVCMSNGSFDGLTEKLAAELPKL